MPRRRADSQRTEEQSAASEYEQSVVEEEDYYEAEDYYEDDPEPPRHRTRGHQSQSPGRSRPTPGGGGGGGGGGGKRARSPKKRSSTSPTGQDNRQQAYMVPPPPPPNHQMMMMPGMMGMMPGMPGMGMMPPVPQVMGVETLPYITDMIVKQKKDMLEAIGDAIGIHYEQENKYEVWANMNGQAFPFAHALEDSDLCSRMCCNARRGFKMRIVSPQQQREVITLDRPCVVCYPSISAIDAQTGHPLGTVTQTKCPFPHCSNEFQMVDTPYTIEGACICPARFAIKHGGQEVGSIQKKWGGILTEMLTDADTFSIVFPQSASAAERATLLGALFLIDFVFFEDNSATSND